MKKRNRLVLTTAVLAATLSSSYALAQEKSKGGSATITFQLGAQPGVEANARAYSQREAVPPLASTRPETSTVVSGQGSLVTGVVSRANAPSIETFLTGRPSCLRVKWRDLCRPGASPPSTGPRSKRGKPAPPSPELIARMLADRALALAPDPQLQVAPGRVGLTGLDSYFWLGNELQPITATATVPGVTVTAEARPVQYLWNFGDGNDTVTYQPGRPWRRGRPGDISHMYETRGAYRVGVEVIWEARWRLGSGAWSHLGYFSNSDARRYPVREMIALLVRSRH